MTEWLVDLIHGIPTYLQIIFLAALPVTELRASIPIAVAMGFKPESAFLLSVIGNILPVLPLLLLLEPVFNLFGQLPFLERFLRALLERTRAKGDRVRKNGAIGLMIFVAIPAPGTGVWTGALLAFLFGIPFKHAFLALAGGAMIAGVLVTMATVGAFSVINSGHGVALVVILVFLALVYAFQKKKD